MIAEVIHIWIDYLMYLIEKIVKYSKFYAIKIYGDSLSVPFSGINHSEEKGYHLPSPSYFVARTLKSVRKTILSLFISFLFHFYVVT